MDEQTDDIRAVVVGGGSGIGAAAAELHRRHGHPVVVWDIGGERDITCDITDPDAVDRALAATVEQLGVPTRLTVSAGIGHAGLLLDAPADDWDRVMGVNAKGVWLVMRAVAGAMRASGTPGSIVATTSISAHLPDRGMGLYCASKAALSALVRVAAAEWASDGIRVNAVGPGVTQTPMLGNAPTDSGWLAGVAGRTPLGRLGHVGDIAPAIHALHRLEWVTGQVLDCDGGLTLTSPIAPLPDRDRAGRAARVACRSVPIDPADVKRHIRDIPDWPSPGITFRDITPLVNDAPAFAATIDALVEPFVGAGIDRVLGVEARGFIFAAPVAHRLGAGFVPVRKAGKLPWQIEQEEYALEYGTDLLEVHTDAIHPGELVVIVDDVLATGGTAATTVRLAERLGGAVRGLAFVLELGFLSGRDALDGFAVTSLATYD